MKRSKKIALVVHCLLNQNARAKGLATKAAIHPRLSAFARRQGLGLIQLPCPEIKFAGIDRTPQDQEFYDRPEFKKIVRGIAAESIQLIKRYQARGYRFYGLIGVKSSPSCGIRTFRRYGKKVKGTGLLVEELRKQFFRARIPFRAVTL